MRALCKGLLIVCLSFLVPLSARADGLPALFQALSPSVGALYAQTISGSLEFNCTVTAIERLPDALILLTAKHCVAKGTAYMVTFDGRQFWAASVWKLPGEDIDPQKYRRAHGDPEIDMALFRINDALNIPTIPLGTIVPEAGRRIVTVGYPMGITKIRYEGIISGRLERPGSDQNGYLIVQVFGAPGSSGSAIVDIETRSVIGVLVSARQSSVGLPVIFATPIEYRRYLVPVREIRGSAEPVP